ncbi:MAG TPA: VWA domain-containing protein [Blastocatellia bacterium]|nr:VWA domain-containing protein [Blastocatellia bacterium]
MRSHICATMLILLIAGTVSPLAARPGQSPAKDQEPVIKIGTDLVQIDAVVLDKNGRVVRGLPKDDFEVFENGKRQQISFFEFVDAGRGVRIAAEAAPEEESSKPPAISTQGPGERDLHRVFAFIIDDLTIRPPDLTYVRQMLKNFVDNQMQPTDLVGIIRTVGGADLLQQFTTDKQLLYRSISSLTPRTSPFNAFNQSGGDATLSASGVAPAAGGDGTMTAMTASTIAGTPIDIDNPNDESNAAIRAYMTLGTASYIIDSMKQLPGRKSMILVSGGIQALGPGGFAPISNGQDTGEASGAIGLPSIPQAVSPAGGAANFWLEQLADRATRAGVAINTMDIRGLSGQTGVPSFEDTPGRSGLGASRSLGFGRTADESMVGNRNPFDVTGAQMGLRELSSATGGMAVLNRNEFNKALGDIVEASDGYYLLAYTPSDSNFKGDFRKLEIKVKGGYKVLSRRGYFARAEEKTGAPKTLQGQMLDAIQSPVAKLDIGLDMMVLYKAEAADKGSVDVELNIDPARLSFTEAGGKKEANIDIAGFIYDQFGRLRGGFSKTLSLSLSPEELQNAYKDGVPFPTQSAALKPGYYELRVGARDTKTGMLGTISRYIEVPDLAKGKLSASTLLLGAVGVGETKSSVPTPISGNRRISRDKDLRYAVIIYNPKRKEAHAKVTTQLTIIRDGNVLYREQPHEVTDRGKDYPMIKVGQLGLSSVKPGRYLMQVEITDQLADKKDRSIVRSMDFAVVQ